MAESMLEGLRTLLLGSGPLVEATQVAMSAAGARVSAAPGHADVAGSIAEAATRLGSLDVCVWYAETRPIGPLLGVDDATWGADVTRILVGAQGAAMAAARLMAKAGGGSIVLVGSMDATHAYPGRSSATAAMAGLLGLVRALGVELAPAGVRANVVLAGPVDPSSGEPPQAGETLQSRDTARIERTLLRSPIHRFVAPGEVAAAIGFVAGRGSAFMTGQTLRVDGGWASLNQAPDGMKFR